MIHYMMIVNIVYSEYYIYLYKDSKFVLFEKNSKYIKKIVTSHTFYTY